MIGNMTAVSLMFVLYISVISCVTNPIFLYGGYVILLFLLFVNLVMSSKDRGLVVTDHTKKMFYFVVYSCLSILWSLDRSLAIKQIPLLISGIFLMVFMTDYLIKLKKANVIFVTISFSGIVLALYVIWMYGGLSSFYQEATSENARLGEAVKNSNLIGMQCGFSVITLFYYALIRKKKICYFFMIIPFITTASSGSRKALLLLFAGVILVIYMHISQSNDNRKYIRVILWALVAMIAVRYILSLDILATSLGRFDRFLNFFGEKGNVDNSAVTRSELIFLGLEKYWNAPVLGNGLGNSVIINFQGLGLAFYSHNDYIELLLNGGIIGFILYYGMYCKLIKEYIFIMKRDKDTDVRFAFYILILFLILNFGCVTYYGYMMTFVYLILWNVQIEIKREEGKFSDNKKSI